MGDVEDKKHKWSNGDMFNGRMIVGTEQGDIPLAGVYKWKNGDIYNGAFLDWKRHANGKMTFANGDVYDGCWVSGNVCGKGKFKSAKTGTVYQGFFGRRRTRQDPPAPDLYDTMIYRGLTTAKGLKELVVIEEAPAMDPSVVAPPSSGGGGDGGSGDGGGVDGGGGDGGGGDGELKPTPPKPVEDDTYIAHAGLLTGKGEIIYPNGRRWNGRFEEGRTVADGGSSGSLWIPLKRHVDDDPNDELYDTYIGALKGFGIPHGFGKLQCGRGGWYEGEFREGLPNGRVKAEYANGDYYEGMLVDGVREGFGRLRLHGGDAYEGHFLDDEYEGRGQYKGSDGTTFEGYFTRGNKQGRGRLISKLGNMFDGYWVDNMRCGIGVSHAPSGERQEAWYDMDVLLGVPRIFFHLNRALPGRVINKVSGASLRAFCASAASIKGPPSLFAAASPPPSRNAKKRQDGARAAEATWPRPIRLDLNMVPGWLSEKRIHPQPAPPHQPVATRIVNEKGRVYLMLSVRKPRPPARARCHLNVRMESPDALYLPRGVKPQPLPFDLPKLQPRVRLELFAVTPRLAGEEEPPVACGVNLRVPPLLEWHLPKGVEGAPEELS